MRFGLTPVHKVEPNLKKTFSFVVILILLTLLTPTAAQTLAEVPRFIRFAGMATVENGKPLSGSVNLAFSIYTGQEDGVPLWSEVQTLTANNGRYSVLLGSSSASGLPTEIFSSSEARWLGVRVNGTTEQPRVMLVSVPYALKAADADTLGGKPLSAFVLAQSTQAAAQVPGISTTPANRSAFRLEPASTLAGSVSLSSAGSPAPNSLPKYVDSSGTLANSVVYENGGNVGINTLTPVAAFHVASTLDGKPGALFETRTSSTVPSGITTGMTASLHDVTKAPALSKQAGRIEYYRDPGASGSVGDFDSVLTTSATLFEQAPYQLRALNVEGPYIAPGKSLNTFYGAYFGKGSGAIGTRVAIATEPDAGKVGIGTVSPAAQLDVATDSATSADAFRTLLSVSNSAPATRVSSALSVNSIDTSTAQNLSKQTARFSYLRSSIATGGVDAFDSILTTTAFLDSNAPYQLRGINVEAPFVSAGKKLDSYYGAYFAGPGAPGTIGTKYALVTDLTAGNVGFGTTTPTAQVEVNGDVKISSGKLVFSDGSQQVTAGAPAKKLVSDGTISISEQPGVTNVSIGSGTIGTALLADLAVSTSKLADNSISTSKIADGSITASKLSSGVLVGGGAGATLGNNNFTGIQTVTINGSTDSAIAAQNQSLAGLAYAVRGESTSPSGVSISGYASSVSGTAMGVMGRSNAPSGVGAYGEGSSTSGPNAGVQGLSRSGSGVGVKGQAVSPSGTNYGVSGTTASESNSAGVYGIATKDTSTTVHYGVYGSAAGTYGVGVFGYATNTSAGTPVGVFGRVDSATGTAGQFTNSASSGNILVANGSSGKVWRVDSQGNQYMAGTVHTGGADFAEFMESDPESHLDPGDVVVISPAQDRHVTKSSEPYSTSVVGIYSTKPGILGSKHAMGNANTFEVPVAMVGIVPTKATAENGSIKRGDLLVSSSIPGHVMKATDLHRAVGAIIGKALQPLTTGTGVIEIVVTLQ